MDKHRFRIAEKMAAWLMGCATEQEQQEIEQWQKENSHRKDLVGKLSDPRDFEKNQELMVAFPVDEGWAKVRKQLGDSAAGKWRLPGWYKYAAVVLLLISGGVWYVLKENQPIVKKTVLVQSVPAGTQGAKLTLGNGKVVEITPGKQFTLSEADGTLIRKNAAGIDYRPAKTGEDTLVYNQMETLTGMEYTLVLSDGTRVYLNAESRLTFPVAFRGNRREVELSGEAYFVVTKDAARPFIVRMNGSELKVLGTSFNVRSYANEPQTIATLVEGQVEVNGKKMSPGQQALYTREKDMLTIREVDVDQYVAWHQGRFVFRNERLEDMMKTLARWYGIECHFVDEAAKDIRLGASFGRYDNMDPIIDMLRRTELVEVVQTNRSLYLSVRK